MKIDQPGTYTVLKGEALEQKPPKAINIVGVLEAPAQFLKGKTIDPLKTHLKIFNAEGELELVVNDEDPYSTHTIKGKLSKDSVLQMFRINTDTRWTIAEFLKFIKTMRFYFADRAAHAKLIDSIQKWSVKIERVIVEHNDNKGNSNFQLETKVQAVDGLVSKFDLNIPIFQGYPKAKFTVEIGLDPKNTAVQLYLISDDLIELEIQTRETAIRDVLKQLEEYAFSKIVVS